LFRGIPLQESTFLLTFLVFLDFLENGLLFFLSVRELSFQRLGLPSWVFLERVFLLCKSKKGKKLKWGVNGGKLSWRSE
jgi:hypothetical protein